jgi:DNA-binding GntR family transcriptional regulator
VPATTARRGAIYQQIADELRARIIGGSIPRGGKLPTEAELTAEHGVNRQTVRSALNVLVNEGLIYSARPQGYFVRHGEPMHYRPQGEFRPQPASPEMDRFLSEHSEKGREPTQTIEVAVVEPPAEVAERLQLKPGDSAVVRRRVRFLDGEPYNINDSYFPLDLAQGTEIMQPGDIARGANQVLAEQGYEQVRAFDEFYIRMPTPEEAHRLDLGPGTPVARHICTGTTADDEPVRVVLNILPGDRHVIVYERAKPYDDDPDPDDPEG